jgi:hypothetical protein
LYSCQNGSYGCQNSLYSCHNRSYGCGNGPKCNSSIFEVF